MDNDVLSNGILIKRFFIFGNRTFSQHNLNNVKDTQWMCKSIYIGYGS